MTGEAFCCSLGTRKNLQATASRYESPRVQWNLPTQSWEVEGFGHWFLFCSQTCLTRQLAASLKCTDHVFIMEAPVFPSTTDRCWSKGNSLTRQYDRDTVIRGVQITRISLLPTWAHTRLCAPEQIALRWWMKQGNQTVLLEHSGREWASTRLSYTGISLSIKKKKK